MVCHQLARFSGHRYCSSTGIVFLICRVIKQEYTIKGSCDYNDSSPSRRVTTVPSLVVTGTEVVEM